MQRLDLPGSGAIWMQLGSKVLRLASDQKRSDHLGFKEISTSYNFYKSDDKEPDDD